MSSIRISTGEGQLTELQLSAFKPSNTPHSSHHQANHKHQQEVGEQAVDAEHDKDDGIIAREVGQIVVDTALDLAKVLGLAEALEVEKLRDGPEVAEPVRERDRLSALRRELALRGTRARGEGSIP